MKKIFLVLAVCFALAGCGQAKMTTTINDSLNIDGGLLGTTNMQAFNVQNMTPTQNETVADVSYAVMNNTGGAGSLAIANVPYQTTCPATIPASPLMSVDIAAATNIPLTSTGTATASAWNSLINQNYTLCAYLTQGTSTPVKFTLQLSPTVQTVFSY